MNSIRSSGSVNSREQTTFDLVQEAANVSITQLRNVIDKAKARKELIAEGAERSEKDQAYNSFDATCSKASKALHPALEAASGAPRKEIEVR